MHNGTKVRIFFEALFIRRRSLCSWITLYACFPRCKMVFAVRDDFYRRGLTILIIG